MLSHRLCNFFRDIIYFYVASPSIAFRIAARPAGVVADDPVIVSGAAIHTRPLPLACVVLICPDPLASIPLTLMAV